MAKLNPYLSFGGNCREAMTFYQKSMGGELILQTVGDSPMADQNPPEAKNNIMHSSLVSGEIVLMGSDMLEPGEAVQGNTVSLSVNCSSEEEINHFFQKLSEGGKVTNPLHSEFWGATFGMLMDKFGTAWMLNYEKK